MPSCASIRKRKRYRSIRCPPVVGTAISTRLFLIVMVYIGLQGKVESMVGSTRQVETWKFSMHRVDAVRMESRQRPRAQCIMRHWQAATSVRSIRKRAKQQFLSLQLQVRERGAFGLIHKEGFGSVNG